MNLPTKISFGNGGFISYLYTANGQKVQKTVQQSVGFIIDKTDYLGGFQYFNELLRFFPHAEGYVNATKNKYDYDFNYVFNYTDHLGNIRLSYTQDPISQVLKVTEENHYYPFGLKHTGYNSDVLLYTKEVFAQAQGQTELFFTKIKPKQSIDLPAYNYKYNGKEWQDELGLNMYDYGWRNYMPDVGRWTQIDPLFNELTFAHDNDDYDPDDEEETYLAIINDLELGGGIYNTDNLNPYGYGYNNPVSFDDPDGRCPTCVVGFFVGAITDYGIQVASNYLDPKVKNKWTDNISLTSIALSGAEGALTQGSSALKKVAINGGITLAKNTVDYNTSTGLKVDTKAKNVLKNTAIDLVADKGIGIVSSVAKTKQLDKVANKVNLNSNTKAKNFVQKVTGTSSRTSNAIAKKADVKGVSKQVSNGVKNLPNKAVENGTKGTTKKYIDDAKDKTKIK